MPRTYAADEPSGARFTHGNAGARTRRSVGAVDLPLVGGGGSGGGQPHPPVSLASGLHRRGANLLCDTDWTDAIRALLRDVALECDRPQRQLATCVDGDGQATTAAAAGAGGGASTTTGHFLGGDGIAASRELLLLMMNQQIARCARLPLQLARAESKVLLQQQLYVVGPAPMPGNDEKGGADKAIVREEDEDDDVNPTYTDTTAAEAADPRSPRACAVPAGDNYHHSERSAG